MSVVPDKDLEMIEWFELRQPQWSRRCQLRSE